MVLYRVFFMFVIFATIAWQIKLAMKLKIKETYLSCEVENLEVMFVVPLATTTVACFILGVVPPQLFGADKTASLIFGYQIRSFYGLFAVATMLTIIAFIIFAFRGSYIQNVFWKENGEKIKTYRMKQEKYKDICPEEKLKDLEFLDSLE